MKRNCQSFNGRFFCAYGNKLKSIRTHQHSPPIHCPITLMTIYVLETEMGFRFITIEWDISAVMWRHLSQVSRSKSDNSACWWSHSTRINFQLPWSPISECTTVSGRWALIIELIAPYMSDDPTSDSEFTKLPSEKFQVHAHDAKWTVLDSYAHCLEPQQYFQDLAFQGL